MVNRDLEKRQNSCEKEALREEYVKSIQYLSFALMILDIYGLICNKNIFDKPNLSPMPSISLSLCLPTCTNK